MTIKKITTGFVIQTFDTDQNKFVSQEFVAGNSEYEDKNGDTISLGDNEEADKTFFAKPGGEPYLPFDMVQPTDN